MLDHLGSPMASGLVAHYGNNHRRRYVFNVHYGIELMFITPVLAGIVISNQVIALSTKEAFTMIKKSAEFITFSTAHFSLSVATSLMTTLLITVRILIVQHASKNNVQKNNFNPVLEILIESAALYSFTLLIFVVLLIRKNSNVYYAQNIHAQIVVRLPT